MDGAGWGMGAMGLCPGLEEKVKSVMSLVFDAKREWLMIPHHNQEGGTEATTGKQASKQAGRSQSASQSPPPQTAGELPPFACLPVPHLHSPSSSPS